MQQAMKRFSFGSSGRLLIVIGLHVALIYVIATSMGIVKAPSFVEPMEATLIDTPQEVKPVKPVLKPALMEPTLDIAEPDVVPIPEVEVPVDIPSSAAITAATEAVESAELSVTNRINPVYPPASRRLGEEGVVSFRVLVDERGRPLQVVVVKSSGFSRLDTAALQAIRKWVFAPAVRNSQAVRSWSRVQVRFRLDAA